MIIGLFSFCLKVTAPVIDSTVKDINGIGKGIIRKREQKLYVLMSDTDKQEAARKTWRQPERRENGYHDTAVTQMVQIQKHVQIGPVLQVKTERNDSG